MAGHKMLIGGSPCFVDYEDGAGEAIINGRTWRWSFHEWAGPLFLKKDGSERKCQNPNKKVWDAFQEWLDKRNTGKQENEQSEPLILT